MLNGLREIIVKVTVSSYSVATYSSTANQALDECTLMILESLHRPLITMYAVYCALLHNNILVSQLLFNWNF